MKLAIVLANKILKWEPYRVSPSANLSRIGEAKWHFQKLERKLKSCIQSIQIQLNLVSREKFLKLCKKVLNVNRYMRGRVNQHLTDMFCAIWSAIEASHNGLRKSHKCHSSKCFSLSFYLSQHLCCTLYSGCDTIKFIVRPLMIVKFQVTDSQ